MLKSNSVRLISILSLCVLVCLSYPAMGGNSAPTELFTAKSDPVVAESLGRILARMGPEDSVPVWVFFTDKGISTEGECREALFSAQSRLSERALKRRAKVHLGNLVDFRDIPVKNDYIQAVVSRSSKKRHVLRWFNAVTVEATKSQIEQIASLPFVREVREIRGRHREQPEPKGGGGNLPQIDYTRNYGPSLEQLQQLNVMPAHELGFYGKGVLVCMHDTGYRKAHDAFAQAFAEGRVLAEWDFVKGDGETDWEEGDEPDQPNHGTITWSTLGGAVDRWLYGPSYGSHFILAKTEDVGSEHHVEEDNWAAGAEWADSIGADVISSSLGYRYDFDPPDTDYTYEDMDGNTTIVTIAADLAAYNGITVCNAMGNDGPDPGSLIAPADADSILSIGAVYSSGELANFSCRGPTFDGRTKPEVCARGVWTFCADPGNMSGYTYTSGTSLSTPLAGGCSGLVLSAHPDWTPMMAREALMMTADNAESPDNDYGWGIINASEAVFYHPEGDIVIEHFPVGFATEAMGSYRVDAKITCDHGINTGELKVFWNTTGVEPFDAIPMTSAGGDTFYADIPSQTSGTTVYYYIYAEDTYGLTGLQPLGAPDHLFSFVVGSARFVEGFEIGPYAWVTGGQGKKWGLSADYSNDGVLSMTDSPVASYQSSSNTWVAMRDGVDLSSANSALLSFYHRHKIWEDDFGYVEVSTDGGGSWQQLGETVGGSQESFVEETCSLDDYLGEQDVRIRFRLTSDVFDNQDGWYIDDFNIILNPTGVEEGSGDQLPLTFSLSQNYPNPFNSSTEIVFSIPKEVQVSLTIYNLLGQVVAEPLDDRLPAGRHSLTWDGEGLSSGLYFYRLTAGEYSGIRRMTVIK